MMLDRIGPRARRRAAACRRHGLPEQTVVHMPTRVVVDGHADVLGKLAHIEQLSERCFLLQIGKGVERRIQFLHV